MSDPVQKAGVTVSLSRLTGYLDGVISNAKKAQAELDTAKRAKDAKPPESILMRIARAALSPGKNTPNS